MNSPYMGRFQITQAFTSEHDGLDLVGLDSKQIHSTVNGTVIHAGWENPSNHSQGFGLYVCIRVGNQDYYYGHMSQIYVSVGQTVKITDIIGLEGSTGYSTGSHCHYCCRVAGTMTPLDINCLLYTSGIGTRTVQHIEEQAKNMGAETIRLDAFTLNPHALNLYEKLGYREVGIANFRKGKFYLMEKKLSE